MSPTVSLSNVPQTGAVVFALSLPQSLWNAVVPQVARQSMEVNLLNSAMIRDLMGEQLFSFLQF
jgi:hypothetical protein